MERLSKNNRVLFFNHSFPVGFAEIEEKIRNPRLWEKRLSKINENLWVFSTVHLCPSQRTHLPKGMDIKTFNYRLKAEALKYLVNKLEFSSPIIITYLGESVKYLNDIPRKMLCYDCVDDFSSFTWSDEDTCLLEEELIDSADLVFTTARELYEKVHKVHEQTYYLPNAVEFDHFQKASITQPIPKDMLNFGHPIIGFVGAFWEWVDEEMVNFIAESRPEWRLVIIGPRQPGMGESLQAMPNVFFLGVKEYAELPQYVSQFDVCLIPFKLNSVTFSANPIKMWEYMASGKPIVSTPIPEVKAQGNLVYIGNGKIEFLQKIEEALQETGQRKSLQRMLKAEANDWNARVKELQQLIKLYEKGESDENTLYQ